MEKREFETLEDLLEDASFRHWATGEPGSIVSFWEDWLSNDPDKKILVEQAIVLLKGIPFVVKEQPIAPSMVKEEWKKLSRRTVDAKSDIRTGIAKKQRRARSWKLRIAACIALVLALGFVLEYYVINPLVAYRTPFGKQLSVVLPDSTFVKLNANSALSYRKQNPRKVWLDGEAFFRVKKKPKTDATFLVLTNDLTVEVLGTAFNVIEKEDKTEVILEEGSVKLNLKKDLGSDFLMEAGDLVIFSAKTMKKAEKRRVKPEILTSWKDGVQQFDDAPLEEIMEKIKAVYGWETIYFNEALKTRRFDFPLPLEDFDEALLLLRKMIDSKIEKVEKEGKVLLLH